MLGNDPSSCPQRVRVAPITVVVDEPEQDYDELDTADEDHEDDEIVGEVPPTVAPARPAPAAPPLVAPVSTKRRLPPSLQLGLTDLRKIMQSRPVRMIGVLGVPNAGKTATLVSLYLLAANGKLDGFAFRNSDSLLAFDQLARGARRWAEDGEMLAQMTLHTELEDPRRPSFLHLRLEADGIGGVVDIAFPDLPGEWSDSFIDSSDCDRLQFLRGVEAIWVMVDGVALSDPRTRQLAANRVQLLLSRIREHIEPASEVPVILVVTRRDKYEVLPAAILDKIKEEARRWSLQFDVIEVAPFSKPPGIEPGFGLVELLTRSLVVPAVRADPNDVPEAVLGTARQMMRYRRRP